MGKEETGVFVFILILTENTMHNAHLTWFSEWMNCKIPNNDETLKPTKPPQTTNQCMKKN